MKYDTEYFNVEENEWSKFATRILMRHSSLSASALLLFARGHSDYIIYSEVSLITIKLSHCHRESHMKSPSGLLRIVSQMPRLRRL